MVDNSARFRIDLGFDIEDCIKAALQILAWEPCPFGLPGSLDRSSYAQWV